MMTRKHDSQEVRNLFPWIVRQFFTVFTRLTFDMTINAMKKNECFLEVCPGMQLIKEKGCEYLLACRSHSQLRPCFRLVVVRPDPGGNPGEAAVETLQSRSLHSFHQFDQFRYLDQKFEPRKGLKS